MLLAPISARRQLNEPSDDMATKISILYYADAYYADAREALAKALGDEPSHRYREPRTSIKGATLAVRA